MSGGRLRSGIKAETSLGQPSIWERPKETPKQMLEKIVSDLQSSLGTAAPETEPSKKARMSYLGLGKMFSVRTPVGGGVEIRIAIPFRSADNDDRPL